MAQPTETVDALGVVGTPEWERIALEAVQKAFEAGRRAEHRLGSRDSERGAAEAAVRDSMVRAANLAAGAQERKHLQRG